MRIFTCSPLARVGEGGRRVVQPHVGDHGPAGAVRAHDGEDEQPDGARSQDRDGLARDVARHADRVHGGGQGLDQRRGDPLPDNDVGDVGADGFDHADHLVPGW